MPKCVNCGAELAAGTKFCTECGTAAPKQDATTGIAIGDKNVIAGDVIGKKEDYHVAGDIVNKTILNETDKVLSCVVCGKHITNVNGFTCSNCGKIACRSHFNQQAKLCNACLEERRNAAAVEYKAILATLPIKNGIFNYQDIMQARWDLSAKGFKLPDKLASEIEEKFEVAARGMSDVEKLELEEGASEFYANRLAQAYKLVAPIFERHPDDEQVLTLYLRIIKKVNPEKGREVIKNLKVDIPEAYLTSADVFLQHKQMEECEKVLDEALRKWPGNVLVNSAMARHLAVCASIYKNNAILEEAEKYIEACGTPSDSYEKGAVDCASAMVAYAKDPASADFGALSAYWASFLSLLTNEASVADDGTGSYTCIAAAINSVSDGAVITVKPGIYKESFSIDKNVTLQGVPDSFGNNPRIVRDGVSTEPLMTIAADSVKISGIDLVGEYEVPDAPSFGPAISEDLLDSVETLLKVKANGVTLENMNIHHSKGFGAILLDAGNISVTKSNFFRNAHSGCAIIGECTGTFTDCYFAENADFGYQIFDSMNLNLENSFEVGNRFGYFTDSRDGQVYRTVKIGKQTWMADNLRYDGGEGCFFYGDCDEEKKRNGGYYTWNAMMNIADKITVEQSLATYNKEFSKDCMRTNFLKEFWTETSKMLNKSKYQGIAPEGFRIPTSADFGELISFSQTNSATGEKYPARGLIAVGDSCSAKATDYFGFSAVSAGGNKFNENQVDDYGKKAKLWTSNVSVSDAKLQKAFALVMNERSMDVVETQNRGINALNLRCILDEDSAVEIASNEKAFLARIDGMLAAFEAAHRIQEMWNRMETVDNATGDKLYDQIEMVKKQYNL